jgi:hypothetical protein
MPNGGVHAWSGSTVNFIGEGLSAALADNRPKKTMKKVATNQQPKLCNLIVGFLWDLDSIPK